MFLKYTFIYFIILVPLIGSFSADATVILKGKNIYDLGYEVLIFEDPTNKLKIDDVIKKEFEPKYISSKEKIPNFGISNSTFWVRVDLENKNHPSNQWMLSFEQVWVDYLDLYKKSKDGWDIIKTGDRRVFSSREINNRNFVFNINFKDKETIYLKVKSNDGISIPLKLYSPIAFTEQENFIMAVLEFFMESWLL